MVDWTTVVISIGASLLGGLLSGTWQVNRSIIKQREERRKRKKKENWYHQINSICLRIHREVLRLPPNEPITVAGYKPELDSDEFK